jgi:hypothetical protein
MTCRSVRYDADHDDERDVEGDVSAIVSRCEVVMLCLRELNVAPAAVVFKGVDLLQVEAHDAAAAKIRDSSSPCPRSLAM